MEECVEAVFGCPNEGSSGARTDIAWLVVHVHVCVVKHGYLVMAKAASRGQSPWKPSLLQSQIGTFGTVTENFGKC